MIRFLSRSAFLTYLTCHKKYFLNYEYSKTGLVQGAVDLNLITGTSVHRGLQDLLEHCRIEHPLGEGITEEHCVKPAVDSALAEFREAITLNSLNIHSTEQNNLSFIIEEHFALIEGLIRSFSIVRLKELLEEYEVLEIEKEEVYILHLETCEHHHFLGTNLFKYPSWHQSFNDALKIIGNCQNCSVLVFLAKADGLFRRKSDSELIVLSIKTTSEYPTPDENNELGFQYSSVVIRNILHDMQGISETEVVQNRINKTWNWLHMPTTQEQDGGIIKSNHWLNEYKKRPTVFAVQYEHLVTGSRRQSPPKSGLYARSTFLVHPTKQDSQAFIGLRTGSLMVNPSNYKWKVGAGKQPKGWNKINIWEDIGVKEWVEMLAQGMIQPEEGFALPNLIRTSELIIRIEDEIAEWKRSIKFWARRIAKDLKEIEFRARQASHEMVVEDQQEKWQQYSNELEMRFDKNTQNCHNYFGHDCQFVPLCHHGMSLDEATTSTLYSIRKPHHQMEEESFKKKGAL